MSRFPAIVTEEIRRYVAESPLNRLPGCNDPYFEEPLVGFAAADDPLWRDFKKIIGAYHCTPAEVVASSDTGVWTPASVISWVLPIAKKTREINREQKLWPSREWVLTANGGNDFLRQLRSHMVEFLRQLGYRAVAPQSVTRREAIGDLEVGVSASWSERHVAYAAGLGTFGRNGGLITERGIAHRCGSVVTELPSPPTKRKGDHRHCCLEGSCGACISRCPSGAISEDGLDKAKCYVHIYRQAPPVVAKQYAIEMNEIKIGSCGLCQTKVPCEARSPSIKVED